MGSGRDTKLDALQRHDKYHIPGGDLFFLVENKHFRVHRYFFERESQFFQHALIVDSDVPAKGASESSALVFDNLKIVDFERFIWIFYNPKLSVYEATIEKWTSILDLAHRWGFNEVKALAFRELEKIAMEDVDRIVLYHKYLVDRTVLLPRYKALCIREMSITVEEGEKLGLETTLRIGRAREQVRSWRPANAPDGFKDCDVLVDNLLTELFVPKKPETSLPKDTKGPKDAQRDGRHNREDNKGDPDDRKKANSKGAFGKN